MGRGGGGGGGGGGGRLTELSIALCTQFYTFIWYVNYTHLIEN